MTYTQRHNFFPRWKADYYRQKARRSQMLQRLTISDIDNSDIRIYCFIVDVSLTLLQCKKKLMNLIPFLGPGKQEGTEHHALKPLIW